MKQIIRKFLIGATLSALIFSSGCKKFLDVNTDPNRVTDANITSELIFTQAANAVGQRQASLNLRFLNNWLGYFSTSGDFAIDQTETSYNISFGFGDALWQNTYNVLFDLRQAENRAVAEKDTVLAGASIILQGKLWQDLVDLYGNIPYSQAFLNDKYQQPAYDQGQLVYASLQRRLDSAINFMGATAKKSFATTDIVNGGNKSLWVKYANTLKLRLLIRQSEVPGFNPATEITKILNNGGVLHSGENIDVNPGYVNETNKQNPFYANYAFTSTGTDANTITRANKYFLNLLTSNADPRYQRFFAPVGSSYVGTTYGAPTGNPTGAQSSKVGPGLAPSPTAAQWIFPAFESMFLEAEAIARGWMPGNAQTAYENAVRENFIWLGVPNAVTAANNYLTTSPIANWANAGSTALSKAKFIAYQKYIALAGIDPVEAYSDLRRLNMIPNTGYLSANPARGSNPLPVRLLYPQSEYTTNGTNANAQGSINAFTTKLFWMP